jgi:hypothetical protein
MEEDFEIEVRYAELASSFTVTMMFGTGIPLLYPIFCLEVFAIYLLDKYSCKTSIIIIT